MLVFTTLTKNSWQQGKGGGMRSEILHIYPRLSLTLISHPVLQNPTSFFLNFFFIFIKFSLILLLFLQAILKRITAKEPHYNHLQWVKKSNSVVPSFFYSCNHVKQTDTSNISTSFPKQGLVIEALKMMTAQEIALSGLLF